ncbi:hypothetical protein D9M68_742660 [compost metagenome]
MVTAHHVAHRINVRFIETDGQHLLLQLRRTRTVRIGQVSHCELSEFGVAGVGVLRQRLVPVPHRVAQRGLKAELVVQPDLGDAVDVAQALGALEVHRVVQAAFEGGDDVRLAQAGATRAAHREDERESVLRVVVGVEPLDVRELGGRAIRQARLGLLVGRFGGERLAHHGLARELGVGSDQGELRLHAGFVQHAHHGVLQRSERGKRALLQRGLGDPGGMFVQAVEQHRGFGQRCRVELVQSDGHGVHFKRWTQAE